MEPTFVSILPIVGIFSHQQRDRLKLRDESQQQVCRYQTISTYLPDIAHFVKSEKFFL